MVSSNSRNKHVANDLSLACLLCEFLFLLAVVRDIVFYAAYERRLGI
jgi:hypothetical protein